MAKAKVTKGKPAKKRGRPAKVKAKAAPVKVVAAPKAEKPAKRRGRPPGSRSKAKVAKVKVAKVKTKKVKKALVMYPHSDKHPAQTQLIDEDVTVGRWTQVKHSGAIPDDVRRGLVRRVSLLQRAVKEARERANMFEVEERRIGEKLFGYIMG